MKKHLLLYFIFFFAAAKVFSQAPVDTIPYKIGYYDVKKHEKLVVVAASLKIDPNVILKLNHLRNIQQDLVKGQRIKIPVYAKVKKTDTKPATKTDSKEKPQAEVTKADTTTKAAKKPEKEKKSETSSAGKKETKTGAATSEVVVQDVPNPKAKKPEKDKKAAQGAESKTDKNAKPVSSEVIVEDVPKPKPPKPEKEKKEKAHTDGKNEAKEKPVTPETKVEDVPKPESKKNGKEKKTGTETTAKTETKSKAVEQHADTAGRAALKEQEKEKKVALEQSRKKLTQDSIHLAQQRQAKNKTLEAPKNNYDPEIDKNNLMLVEATLELNEAMLAGVKASLDTLNKPDPEIKNGNDVKEILQHMKRNRDRTELKPYLEYMNDSLSLDCNKLRTQKEDILSRLTPYFEHERMADSLATAKQNAPVASLNEKKSSGKAAKKTDKHPAADNVVAKDTANKSTAQVASKNKGKDKQKDLKSAPGMDTVLVYDAARPVAMKPAKEKNVKPTPPVTKTDTANKPEPELLTQNQILEHKKGSWDTARAVVETPVVAEVQKPTQKEEPIKQPVKTKTDSVTVAKTSSKKPAAPASKIDSSSIVKKQAVEKKTTTQASQSHPVSKRDSIANSIQQKVMETKVKPDTLQETELKAVVEKKDTVSKENKATVAKAPEKKVVVADNSNNADTIKKIKSEFFLKRAQKAITEKKTKDAEDYLLKSIELWNNNFDAWMALAEQDAQFGSPVKALKEYQECVRIDSSRPKLFYSIASIYDQSKKKTEAVQYYTKTIGIDSNYIPAYMGRASIYSDWKQYDASIADYDKVLTINKSYHAAYKARGMVNQLTRHFSEAVDDFTRYLIFEETDPSAYFYRGLAKIGNKELLEGCLDLSKASEMGYAAADKAIKKSCE